MKFIPLSILLLFISPCNKPKSIASTTTQNDKNKVTITFRETACFGTCPVFTMTINGETNTATYLGEQNVTKIGTFAKYISNDSISKLTEAFEKIHFFDLDEKNFGNIPDLPSIIISYSSNGKTKTIEESTNKPSSLRELENLLKEIADSEGWRKMEEKEKH